MGINLDYKHILMKTGAISLDSPYSFFARPILGGVERRERLLRVDIPGRTQKLGGFMIGLGVGLNYSLLRRK